MSGTNGKTLTPSDKGEDARDDGGRFTKGYRGGKGNPFAKQVAQLRAVYLQCVTPAEYRKAVKKILSLAQRGDVAAFKELSDRLLGKAKQPLEVTGRDGRSVKIKHVFDLERFAAELVRVERERSSAAGRVVPAHSN